MLLSDQLIWIFSGKSTLQWSNCIYNRPIGISHVAKRRKQLTEVPRRWGTGKRSRWKREWSSCSAGAEERAFPFLVISENHLRSWIRIRSCYFRLQKHYNRLLVIVISRDLLGSINVAQYTKMWIAKIWGFTNMLKVDHFCQTNFGTHVLSFLFALFIKQSKHPIVSCNKKLFWWVSR